VAIPTQRDAGSINPIFQLNGRASNDLLGTLMHSTISRLGRFGVFCECLYCALSFAVLVYKGSLHTLNAVILLQLAP